MFVLCIYIIIIIIMLDADKTFVFLSLCCPSVCFHQRHMKGKA